MHEMHIPLPNRFECRIRLTSKLRRNIWLGRKPDYSSPSKNLEGYLYSIGSARETDLAISFFPQKMEKPPATYKEKKQVLREGIEDVTHLIDSLEGDNKLKRVNLVRGFTNPAVALFAVKHLGFHFEDIELTQEELFRLNEVFIYSSKQELLAKRAQIQKTAVRLFDSNQSTT